MKITNIKSFPVWGGNRNFFFVKVETDAGIYGIGEGGITWRELAAAACVDHLKPLLIGEDPSQIEHLWQLMFRGGFFPLVELLALLLVPLTSLYGIYEAKFSVYLFMIYLGDWCEKKWSVIHILEVNHPNN